MRTAVALTIAGSDPSGGAGIQADLKTFSALGVYGAAALTALTVQNTRGVYAVAPVAPDFVAAQIEAVLSDLRVCAIKIGMLEQRATVEAVAAVLCRWPHIPLILDPVTTSKNGTALLDKDGVKALQSLLVPRATLITPNLPEAAVLLNLGAGKGNAQDVELVLADQRGAAQRLVKLGAKAVLLKGGHDTRQEGPASAFCDDLYFDGALQQWQTLSAPRLHTANTHGTGCTLASAIAAGLALGHPLLQSVQAAKQYLHAAIAAADTLDIVQDSASRQAPGHGPVHHFFQAWKA